MTLRKSGLKLIYSMINSLKNEIYSRNVSVILLARCVADMLPPRGDASLWEEVGLLHHLCPCKRNKGNKVYNSVF